MLMINKDKNGDEYMADGVLECSLCVNVGEALFDEFIDGKIHIIIAVGGDSNKQMTLKYVKPYIHILDLIK